jgi:arylsulfatase A-like enzyme
MIMRLARTLAGILIGPCVLPASPGRAEERPNVVLIVADDLGWNDVGYHNPEIKTPNLDRLAARGVRLEHHYVFPTCSPTRCALLTGRNPSRFGILGPIDGRSGRSIPPGTVTLAHVFGSQRYATAIVGKWHLGLRHEVGPRAFGFGSGYGYLHGQIDPDTHLYKNGDRTWYRQDEFVDEPGHATDLLAAATVQWIETHRSGPFFLDL